MASMVKVSRMPLLKWEQRAAEKLEPHEAKEPRDFRLIEPEYEKAIVIPWLSNAAVWDELKYTLRSIELHWKDKECPIIIIGDAPPVWLKEGGRIRFIHIKEYEESRAAGLWEAWQVGMQIADKVAWWNDDIYLLKDVGWGDIEIALTEGEITDSQDLLRASINGWRRSMGEAVGDLLNKGLEKVLRFATHTPFLFEREKSLQIFRGYHLNYKGSWVNLYHNHHQTPHTECKPFKTRKLPTTGGESYYNHSHNGPDPKTRTILSEMFPTPALWENGA